MVHIHLKVYLSTYLSSLLKELYYPRTKRSVFKLVYFVIFRCNPYVLAGAIHDCARELHACPPVRHVIVGEVMKRFDHCQPDFETARQHLTAELRRLVHANPAVHQYHYWALSKHWEQHMLRDGVHLNKGEWVDTGSK